MKIKIDKLFKCVMLIMQLTYAIIQICLLLVIFKLVNKSGVATIGTSSFGNLVKYVVLSVGYYWLKISQRVDGVMLVPLGSQEEGGYKLALFAKNNSMFAHQK